MLDTDRPMLTVDQARAVLAQARRGGTVAYAAVGMLLLTGQRAQEVIDLRVGDYADGRVRTGTCRRPRTVRVAPTACAAVGAHLAERGTVGLDEPLIAGLEPVRLVQLVRRTADAAGVPAGVHDLRRAAIAVVLEDGTPVHHVEAYFGFSRAPRPKDLVPVREGYDQGIVDVLEAAFA